MEESRVAKRASKVRWVLRFIILLGFSRYFALQISMATLATIDKNDRSFATPLLTPSQDQTGSISLGGRAVDLAASTFGLKNVYVSDGPTLIENYSQPLDSRECVSPEANVRWVYQNDNCSSSDAVVGSSKSSSKTCTICGQNAFTTFMLQVREQSQRLVGNEPSCKSMVMMSALFGKRRLVYFRLSSDDGRKTEQLSPSCFFRFLLQPDVEEQAEQLSKKTPWIWKQKKESEPWIVMVPLDILPYQNMRRSIKLFKFHAPQIFSWTDRIVWMDAKFPSRPSTLSVQTYLKNTIHHHDVCAVMVGLPRSKMTMQRARNEDKLSNPSYDAHCRTVVNAKKKRPNVTDMTQEAIWKQCHYYIDQVGNMTSNISTGILDESLVDTAFIAWDLRWAHCRQFHADFSCTWADQVQCFSDRDQLSLPYTVHSMGLQRKNSPGADKDHANKNKIWMNEEGKPVLEIVKSSCHWYLNKTLECALEGNHHTPISKTTRGTPKQHRVAIVVAGTLQRFMFNSSLLHLIRPMVEQGHKVDYFLSLTTHQGKPYRSDVSYMSHIHLDPYFTNGTVLKTTTNSSSNIKSMVERSVKAAGGELGEFLFRDQVDIDSNKLVMSRREIQKKEHGHGEDPDLRFPLLDIRTLDIGVKTANANRNLLRLHLAIEELWQNSVLAREAKTGRKYDYVLFVRDDSLWLADLDLNGVTSATEPSVDIYVPACDARVPAMAPEELNDHFIIAGRGSANTFGTYFSTLFQTDLKACSNQISSYNRAGGKRGCNSEMILKYILKRNGLKVGLLGQSEVPFQRSVNVVTKEGTITQCFHKFCQSKNRPLIIPSIRKCTKLTF
jgi:hypothetical protein